LAILDRKKFCPWIVVSLRRSKELGRNHVEMAE